MKRRRRIFRASAQFLPGLLFCLCVLLGSAQEEHDEEGASFFVEPAGEQPQGEILLDARGSLAGFFEDGDGLFMLSPLGGQNSPALNTISSGETRFTHSKYDGSIRVVSKMVWQKKDGPSEPLSRTEYRYKDESAKTPETQETVSFLDGGREKIYFTEGGLPRLVRRYKTEKIEKPADSKGDEEGAGGEKGEESGEGEGPPILLSETQYLYDGENRVERKTARFFDPEDGARVTRTETTRYGYTEFSEDPDTEFFRDGKLAARIVHGPEGERTETRFLPGEYSVESIYQNGVLAGERFLLGDRELRRHDY
ncbi:MAG: hypothetical protein LBR23_09320 [Spirochaetaceae bacterium]|jgi:hypothetical protein|nr:hypothetical protein [Spirochaetaceae bacterium]